MDLFGDQSILLNYFNFFYFLVLLIKSLTKWQLWRIHGTTDLNSCLTLRIFDSSDRKRNHWEHQFGQACIYDFIVKRERGKVLNCFLVFIVWVGVWVLPTPQWLDNTVTTHTWYLSKNFTTTIFEAKKLRKQSVFRNIC